jgi:hypothetical protein
MLAGGLTTLDNGYCDVYDGVKPTDPSVAVGIQVRLARLRFQGPIAPYPALGVTTTYALTSDSDTVGGTATWCRISNAALAAQIDGTVGLVDADLVLNTVTFLTHGGLDIPAITFTQPKG